MPHFEHVAAIHTSTDFLRAGATVGLDTIEQTALVIGDYDSRIVIEGPVDDLRDVLVTALAALEDGADGGAWNRWNGSLAAEPDDLVWVPVLHTVSAAPLDHEAPAVPSQPSRRWTAARRFVSALAAIAKRGVRA
jgi:hypothetical protein